MKRTLIFLSAALSVLLSATCFAHSDDYLDSQPTPHNGQMRMAGAYHFELVARANELTVYLTDHAGAKIAAKGASGSATVLSGKSKSMVKLLPAGDNALKGSGAFELTPGLKVIVSVSLPGQPAEQARFTPLQKTAAH